MEEFTKKEQGLATDALEAQDDVEGAEADLQHCKNLARTREEELMREVSKKVRDGAATDRASALLGDTRVRRMKKRLDELRKMEEELRAEGHIDVHRMQTSVKELEEEHGDTRQ